MTSQPDSETVTADQNPALDPGQDRHPSTYDEVGDTICYSYLVTNIGNVTLDGSGHRHRQQGHRDVPAQSASLAPTGQVTCTATYSITQADLDAGSVTNIAAAQAARHRLEHRQRNRHRRPARPR